MKRINPSSSSLGIVLILLLTGSPLLFTSLKPVSKNDFKFPVIVKKEDPTTSCLTPFYMMNAWYHLERLEKLSDTLYLNRPQERKVINEHFFEFYEDPAKGNTSTFSDEGLTVLVDTIQEITMLKQPIWASYLFHRSFNRNIVLQDDTLSQYVKSFPIYITNTSITKTAILETQDGSAIMIAEAQDKHGKWKPIEYWSGSWCGNSYFTMTIEPGYFAFTRGIKCSGDTKRLCRLKLTNKEKTIYSNMFYMNINESQFNKPSQVK